MALGNSGEAIDAAEETLDVGDEEDAVARLLLGRLSTAFSASSSSAVSVTCTRLPRSGRPLAFRHQQRQGVHQRTPADAAHRRPGSHDGGSASVSSPSRSRIRSPRT